MDAIQKTLVDPLQPYLRPVVSVVPKPVHDAIISLVGSSCHNTLVVNLDLAQDPECTSLAISKALGIGIVGASGIVKVPQILKLIRSRSSAGVSFVSYALETASLLITLSYGVRNQFPFSTYGESAFIAAQDVLVGVLVLTYAGRSAAAAAFVAVVAASIYTLLVDTTLIDGQTMAYLQAGAGALGVASKVPQILTIWQEGGTGQLSAFAVCPLDLHVCRRMLTITEGVQLPCRLLISYFHHPPRSRRQAYPVRIPRRFLTQSRSRGPDAVLLEQPGAAQETEATAEAAAADAAIQGEAGARAESKPGRHQEHRRFSVPEAVRKNAYHSPPRLSGLAAILSIYQFNPLTLQKNATLIFQGTSPF
jgi:uncharacterized protein with PQ loop repeat